MEKGTYLKKILPPLILTLLVWGLTSLKANRFSLLPSELFLIQHTNSLKEAIAAARTNEEPAFIYVITALFRAISHDDLYLQRLPGILVAIISVFLFYIILRHFKFKYPFFTALVPATSFIFVYFAKEIGPPVWLAGGVLALIFFSYLVFLERYEADFWPIIALAVVFLVLPTFHFLAYFIIGALDLALVFFLIGKRKYLFLSYLFFFNLFSFIPFVTWGDVVVRFFVKNFGLPGKDFSLTQGKEEILTRLDLGTWQIIFYRFLGDSGWWGKFLLLIALVLTLFLVWRLIKGLQLKNLNPREIGASFALLFSIIFLTIIIFLPPLWPSLLENYLVLFWPFWLLVLAGLSPLLESKKPNLRFASWALVGLIILSNFINTGSYLLSPGRFRDWQALASRVKEISEKTPKTRLVINQPEKKKVLEPYFTDQTIIFDHVEKTNQLQERIDCCQKDIIYLHLGEQKLEDPEIKRLAIQAFNHKEIIWQSPYLEFLARRNIFPYFSTKEMVDYYKPIIFY